MTAPVRLPAAADPTRSSPAQNPRLGAPRAAMPIGDGQTTDRRVGVRSPGQCPSLSVTLSVGVTSSPTLDIQRASRARTSSAKPVSSVLCQQVTEERLKHVGRFGLHQLVAAEAEDLAPAEPQLPVRHQRRCTKLAGRAVQVAIVPWKVPRGRSKEVAAAP